MISSCFQFFSNKNIGNVILFALQINHLDSLLNILSNLKDCRAPSPVNQAASHRLPLLRVPVPMVRLPSVPALWPRVLGRSGTKGYLFLKIRLVWVIAPQSSVLYLLIRNHYSGVTCPLGQEGPFGPCWGLLGADGGCGGVSGALGEALALDGCQQAFGALETTEATWARGGGQAEGQLQWAPWPLGWGQPAWGPLGSRGPAPAGPPSWEGCPPAMVEGMGERGQAVVTGGGAFSLASLFLQPLRWTHPELGGPSPWKAVGGGGPLAPSYVPHPAHHTPHPACPPFTPRPVCSPGDGHP